MKEVDDTPVPESESEDLTKMIVDALKHLGDECKYSALGRLLEAAFKDRDEVIRALTVRLANLETRKNWQGHPDENDDPEWYA